MPNTGKYFHINDLLTFYTGKSLPNEACDNLTAPDGETVPKWQTAMTQVFHVAGYMTGRDYWVKRETGEYDGFALRGDIDRVRRSMAAQLPWLKDYANPSFPENGLKEREVYARAYTEAAAQKHGVWHQLEPIDAPALAAAAPRRASSPKPR